MSETFSKGEVIPGVARPRRFTTEQKLLVVNETLQPGMLISYVDLCERPRLPTDAGTSSLRTHNEIKLSMPAMPLWTRELLVCAPISRKPPFEEREIKQLPLR